MAERICLSIVCGCGTTLRMSSPTSGYNTNDDTRTSIQAEVAKAFLGAHPGCGHPFLSDDVEEES